MFALACPPLTTSHPGCPACSAPACSCVHLPPSAATSNSRFNPSFQDALQGGAAAIAGGSDGGWALPIGSLVLGLRHVGLSGYNPTECMAVEHELAAWQRAGGFGERENALRWAYSVVAVPACVHPSPASLLRPLLLRGPHTPLHTLACCPPEAIHTDS
jgi:hypothetical protein